MSILTLLVPRSTARHESAGQQVAFHLLRFHPCGFCVSCPRRGLLPPSGISMTPTPLVTGGRGGYLLRLRPSSPTKAMKFFGISAQTSQRTAGLGGSRQPSSRWSVFQTTSSPRASNFWSPRALLLRGAYWVCLLWRSTFLIPRKQQFPKVIMSPSPPLDVGGLGGPYAPSHRRIRRLSQSLCEVIILWGGILNLIQSLKNTPHHALAGSGHRLHMGGALTLVVVSLPLPSLR